MSVYAARRETKKGTRWYVRAELPGRPIIHLGTFDTEKRAKKRIEAAKDEIADGKVPQRFPDAPVQETTLARAAAEWLATRKDIKERGRRQYATIIRGWPARLAAADPFALTHRDVQAWIDELAERKKRGSILADLGVLRMVLDYANASPNPARDPRVKLPRATKKQPRLPTRSEIALIHAALPTRVALLVLLEHTGLRIHEAAALKWRDIDTKRDRLLVASSKTDAGTRWVDRLPGDPPFPKRPPGADPNSLVFGAPSPLTLTNVLAAAHRKKTGSVPLFSAHDWRHLHCSRLMHDGTLSPPRIAERVGHANSAITLSIYSHVLPPD